MTIGSDLTRNNQLNARPTFAASCSEANVGTPNLAVLIQTLSAPTRKSFPYGLGTGPSNVSLNMRVSKVIGIGPKVEHGGAAGGGSVDAGAGAAVEAADLAPGA